MFSNGNWLILLFFVFLAFAVLYLGGIVAGKIDLTKPIFKRKVLGKQVRQLKEKHGPGLQYYPSPDDKWQVQLNGRILDEEQLRRARLDLTHLGFSYNQGSDEVESWFN